MIFGIDADIALKSKSGHSYTNFNPRNCIFGSSNIIEAMQTDPIWEEDIEIKQAVQDQFQPIGDTHKRLLLKKNTK